MSLTTTPASLGRFAAFLRDEHLPALATENLRLARAYRVPLLDAFAHLGEEELLQLTVFGLEKFLTDLVEGRALEVSRESLVRWEEGQLTEIPEEATITPEDMVLVSAAQRAALLAFVDRFAPDAASAIAVVQDLEAYYTTTQVEAMAVFTRMRERAAQEVARAETERAAALAQAETLQSLNEELSAQGEELQGQADELLRNQDELSRLNEALRARNAVVEEQVAERTRHLQDRDQQMSNAQTLGNFGNWEWDIRTGDVTWSDQLYRIYGFEPGSRGITLDFFLGCLVPEDRAMVQEAIQAAIAACGKFQLTERVTRPDGSIRVLESNGEVLADATGSPTKVRGVCQDVTVRKEVEEQLHAAYEELQAVNEELTMQTEELVAVNDELQTQAAVILAQRSLNERIVESAPAGIAFLDAGLVYRRLNGAYAHLMGMTVEDVQDRSIWEVFPDGATDQFEGLMREVQRTGVPYSTIDFPFRFTHNGEERLTYWDFTYQPVLDAQGEVGILILEIEVSDRQEKARLQTEKIAQLQELDRYKDEFLSVISHELRTPLNFIMGFASTLEDEVQGPLNAKQQEAVGRILNGADRMLALVDDLLDFAKIQSGRFDLVTRPTPVAPLVGEVLGLLKPLADQKRLDLTVGPQADVSAVIDAARVAQVITNLVNNAIKFTDPGGRITVSSEVRGDRLHTSVHDTGCGILPEHLPKLFHRFQQIDMSSTRRAGGTGLGLAISKALVEAHGGEIGVESQEGAGSTFWFALPLARP